MNNSEGEASSLTKNTLSVPILGEAIAEYTDLANSNYSLQSQDRDKWTTGVEVLSEVLGNLNRYVPEENSQILSDRDSLAETLDYFQTTAREYAELKFYLMQTPSFKAISALQEAASGEQIEAIHSGTEILGNIQTTIALAKNDVPLAIDYSDLDLALAKSLHYGESYDLAKEKLSIQPWSIGQNSFLSLGKRLAEYLALDRGETNVLSFTNSQEESSATISLPRSRILDLNLAETSSLDLIEGTDAPDLIVGTYAEDRIVAGKGNDLVLAGQGKDTLTGGAGRDVFLFDSTLKENLAAHRDLILDFELGENCDRLDFAELFDASDLDGSNSNIIREHLHLAENSQGDLLVQFDRDGLGAASPETVAILRGIDLEEFAADMEQYIIVLPTEF